MDDKIWVLIGTIEVHHLAISFLFVTPCQIFIPKSFYIITSIPLFFSISASQFLQLSIVAERWTAAIFVRNYESGYRRLGPALTAASGVVTIGTLYFMYYGETFDTPQWNARMMPSTTYPRSSVALLVLLILNFIGLILTVALYFFSRKQRKIETLSSKFQSNENAVVASLLFWTSSIQFTVLFFAQIIGLYLRTYEVKNPLRTAYRENSDLFNYYTMILPILSTVFFVKVKRRRIRSIANNVNMKAVGDDGWANYSAVIEKQWN